VEIWSGLTLEMVAMTEDSSPIRPPQSLGSKLVPLRQKSGWLLAAGVTLIVLGVLGLLMTAALSIASAIWFGAMVLVAGIVLVVDAIRHGGWRSRLLHGAIGLLYLAVGVVTFMNPLAVTASLTLFVGAALFATGVLRIIIAFQTRPNPSWSMILISGLLSLVLGVLIVMQWPASSLWVLGTFLAIELIFQGFATITLARAIRSTFDGVITKKAV
jgi:uncharacterized membrane protein HdeD (DUF308 family)